MTRDRGVSSGCRNASNPFHICAEYCAGGAAVHPTSKILANRKTAVLSVPRGVGSEGSGERIGGRESNVDPSCVNASNPFHQCAEYCTRRNPAGKWPAKPMGAKLFASNERVVMVDNRKVNPSCPNASNPFHQCEEYCSQKGMGQYKKNNSGGSSKGSANVVKRKDVNSTCTNASNPFHKCGEYCS
ncbi:hypothetical protein HPP92_012930 [Vanilla planifolia]|uniref:Uncharacterized protein n=1 Tax=Vanilla planifolia TaxID=51239 RepID=A0A835QP10_VANPL|nr:hypothetical protein HPP92_012930 [Vanilla planifolia]